MSFNIRDYLSDDHIESIGEIAKSQSTIIQALSLDNSQKDKEIERLNNIINETKEYLEYQLSQLDFYEDTKAKMLGSMAIVLLKGSDSNE